MCRYVLLAILLLLQTWPVLADEAQQLAEILAARSAPTGVVYEIVGGDAASLQRAMQRAQTYTQQLREKFPALKVAIVTHGLEQFALLRRNAEEHGELHRQVRRIVEDEKIPAQVCGAFAAQMGEAATDFMPSVEVVAAGPAQIEEYRYQGYAVLEMELK